MNEITVNLSNITKICRVCLQEKDNNFTLSTSFKFESQDDCFTISEVITRLSLEKIDSNVELPLRLCSDCFVLLQNALIFKLKYEFATNVLKEYVKACANEKHDQDFSESHSVQTVPKIKQKKTTDTIIEEQPEETKELQHPCPICYTEFPALQLRKHIQSHKSLKKYLNIPKNQRISKSTKFYSHRTFNESFFSQPVIYHKCPFCEVQLPWSDFKKHVEQHTAQKEFHCDKCTRVFKKINHLNTHKTSHLKEFPYKCDVCEKGFVIKTNYECHMLTHTDVELPHECNHCFKKFSNPEHLNRHILIHTENISYSVKYKVRQCRQCLKSFKDKESLRSHQCMPVEDKMKGSFQCKICSKDYKNYNSLYSHIRNVHKEIKAQKTLCPVCGIHVSNIYIHNLKHTGERPFACNQCEKRFPSKPQLKKHLLVHSGLKPFVCCTCSKAFNNAYNLQVHERIHRGDRCHICPICNKGFLEKSYLKKHLNVHKKLDNQWIST